MIRFLRFSSLLLIATTIEAASFLVPPDEELIRRADSIFSGVVVSTEVRQDDEAGYVTVSRIEVSDLLKGTLSSIVEIVEEGGILGQRGVIVSGVPSYSIGERVLVFTENAPSGRLRTWGGQLGKFVFSVADNGGSLLVRESQRQHSITFRESDWKPYLEQVRLAAPFTQFIRNIAQGVDASADYLISVAVRDKDPIKPAHHVSPDVYSRGSDQGPASRWTRFDAGSSLTYTVSGSPTGAQISAAQFAIALWSSVPGSNIALNLAGTSSDPYSFDGKNTIVFNSSNVPGGGVAVARWTFDGVHVKDGATFASIIEGDVAIRPSVSPWAMQQVVAHEVGHTLGFRHSDRALAGEPSASEAIMASIATGLTALEPYDREAATHMYGGSGGGTPPPCTAATIKAQPQSRTIASGQSAVLTVAATGGQLPYTYQWMGSGSAISGATNASYSTGALTQTTTFTARITTACGAATDSSSATITVSSSCEPGHLCFHNGRFKAALFARDPRTGAQAVGQPLGENELFGYFSIPALTGDPDNLEVFVKVLDGRAVTGAFWVFYGGLTDLSYDLVVTDTSTGQVEIYSKPAGSSEGGFDTQAFNGTPLTPGSGGCAGQRAGVASQQSSSSCSQDGTRLCLLNNRFRVRLTARDHRTGNNGTGVASRKSDGFGYFAIPSLTGQAENPEVFVKMIDARSINGFWVFFAGLTDLEYTITVTDVTNGRTKTYTKAANSPCGGFDTSAFN